MRKSFPAALLVALMMLASTNLLSAPDAAADLKKADQDWAKAAEARNVDQFLAFIGDDAYMCDLSGKWLHGKDTIKADWTKAFSDPTFKLSWTAESADSSKDGTMGYTRGSFHGEQGGKPFSGSYATVWKKQKDGKWRVAVDIATPQTGQ